MTTAAEQLAAAVQRVIEETVAKAIEAKAAQPQAQRQRQKLSVVAADKGVPASTLRMLIGRKEITAVRFGNKRGVWLVDPEEVERYFQRQTSVARGSRLVAITT
jgi:hypothetical protein